MVPGYRHRPRQPLRLDRASQPARLPRGRDQRGDGVRPRRRRLLLLLRPSTALRRRGSRTAAPRGSRSSSSSSPARRSSCAPSRTPSELGGGPGSTVDDGEPGAAAHRPLLPRPLRALRALPRPRRGPRRLRRRGRVPLRHRLRGAPDDVASRTSPWPATSSTRSTRSPATCSRCRTGPGRSTSSRGGSAPQSSAVRGADARARRSATSRGCPALRPLRRRGRRSGRSRRGLAVVRPLQLPGDRAPRHRRRQLPRRCTRASSRRPGTGEAALAAEASARWTELAGRCSRPARRRSRAGALGRVGEQRPARSSRPRSGSGLALSSATRLKPGEVARSPSRRSASTSRQARGRRRVARAAPRGR